jgi:tetratricopeptide (TPR) repeat protein
MSKIEKTIFISYRRTYISWALAISQYLTHHGYDVFIDYQNIDSGDFEKVIFENIMARAHFLILLAPSVLERCENINDMFRMEIELALDNKRNVIPIMLPDFDFGSPEANKYLTGKLAIIKQYNGLEIPANYFYEGMERLCNRFLNISLDSVLHPISDNVQQIVDEEKRIISLEPKVEEKTLTAQEWFERGYISNNNEEKIRYYTKAIELDPTLIEAYNNRGVLFQEKNLLDQALEDYGQAIKLDPTFVELFSNRGACLVDKGMYQEALKDFDIAISIDPSYAEPLYNRGDCYTKLGNIELAIEDYKKFITLKPDYEHAYYNLACCFALQENLMETIFWLRKAITKNKDYYCKFVSEDNDFEKLRKEKYFIELIEELCSNN